MPRVVTHERRSGHLNITAPRIYAQSAAARAAHELETALRRRPTFAANAAHNLHYVEYARRAGGSTGALVAPRGFFASRSYRSEKQRPFFSRVAHSSVLGIPLKKGWFAVDVQASTVLAASRAVNGRDATLDAAARGAGRAWSTANQEPIMNTVEITVTLTD